MLEFIKILEKYIMLLNKLEKELQFNRKIEINVELKKYIENLRNQGFKMVENHQSWIYKNYEVVQADDVYMNDQKIATRLSYLLKNGSIRYVLV